MEENNLEVLEETIQNTSLLDCYRIALDFGLPAAERAIHLMDNVSLFQSETVSPD